MEASVLTPHDADAWLLRCGVDDLRRGRENVAALSAACGVDLWPQAASFIATGLTRSADAGMALNNLDRWIAASRDQDENVAIRLADRAFVETLLQLFGSSQMFSDLLIQDAGALAELRQTGGAARRPKEMQQQLASLMADVEEPALAGRILRQFRKRQLLRIGYGDMICGQPLEVVVDQISHLADAVIGAAVQFQRRRLESTLGSPGTPWGKPCRFVVLALGKLGGRELNYSSDVDLMFLFECDGVVTGSRHLTHQEFFTRLGSGLIKLLSDHTEHGVAYRVDLRLRPEGQRGPLARSIDSANSYYDLLGRTWERQALIKARAIAGDIPLGRQFLFRLEPWIYRRYLNFAEINGIKALKRRIELRADQVGEDSTDVKTGRGGIRDVEFSTQFLQLLNGGDLPQVRTANTLSALERLTDVGCLTLQEQAILADSYRFLRKVEHRLQTMFDLQTHRLPSDPREIRKLALRLGYRDSPEETAGGQFEADYQLNTRLNRTILNHLLHDAFPDDESARVEPEVDLILDPHPEPDAIQEVLGRHRFRCPADAYRHLLQLSRESIPFLSTPRCRHFLAAIAPRLLAALAETPDPDGALVNLANVSESLGGKAVLWELFSFNPPSLRLYVDLCARSQFLVDVLTRNPGMLDELMDSLVLNRPRSLAELKADLRELCRGAADPRPTLHGFHHTEILRVGVQDLLGKETLPETLTALSDVAETLLHEIAAQEMRGLLARWGQPLISDGPRAGEECRMALVALGKLGGRELTFHSDLDIVFLYEADGMTDPPAGQASTTNLHFFCEWAQRIIRTASEAGLYGKLYDIDSRLRPAGQNGSLAVSLAEYQRYFATGDGQLWERQALTRARVIFGEPAFAAEVGAVIKHSAYGLPFPNEGEQIVREMRQRLEHVAGEFNLKRGPGGLIDIEFLVQTLQLKHGQTMPGGPRTNTRDALDELHAAGLLTTDQHQQLRRSYDFLAEATKHLRLMSNASRDRLPTDPDQLDQFAVRMGYARDCPSVPGQAFLEDWTCITTATRQIFNELLPA